MKKINAKIVADSIDPRGNRITSYIITYPRMIHSELMTHRMFSRNAASSRAIPFAKMVKSVQEDPFIPIAWQKDHKGMQGTEYFSSAESKGLESSWLFARDKAVSSAKSLSQDCLTKQLCNRLLEPFQWYTCLVTATEYDNFFELRCPKYKGSDSSIHKSRVDFKKNAIVHYIKKSKEFNLIDWLELSISGAEIHIQALAEAMWDAHNESKPKLLKTGEWHIPFGDRFDMDEITKVIDQTENSLIYAPIKIATARCARLSYMTFDNEIDYEKDIKLHDQLLESGHMSPFEHCAKAMSDEESAQFRLTTPLSNGYNTVKHSLGWCNNFRGFIQYRYLIE